MTESVPSRVRCGDVVVDLKAGEVHALGRKIRLQEQPLQVLRILLEGAGKVITREEIRSKLWPNDTVVEFDNAINTAIRKLRLAFADTSEHPKYIETVARRGYRFIMAVEELDSSAGNIPVGTVPPASPDAGTAFVDLPGDLSGKTVSHYRVLEVIGGGGMGVLYKAEDLRLNRPVALKFLPEEMGRDQRAVERFEREARAASTLDHPNICSIYEFGEHEGQPFIVMPLLQGETLRDRLAAGKRGESALPLAQLVELAIQIARGLATAHEKGIIHRDIKPANIFITTTSMAKILDFGLAKVLEEAGNITAVAAGTQVMSGLAPPPSAVGLNLSHVGVAIGTAGYMSPEQVRGEALDARTDLFSFGLVLYEMAAGHRAFSGETAAAVRDAILNQTPVPVRELNPVIPPKLEAVIDKALAKDREVRYRSATEIVSDLENLSGSAGRERRHLPPRRFGKLLPAAALAMAAVIAGGIYWHSQSPPILSEKSTVVLADFTNTTGDVVFDDTLRQALAFQLDQSPYLNVLSDRKMIATLRQMEQAPEQRVTPEIAAEICLRSHGSAVLAGSIAPLGSSYEIVIKALSCQTGHTLATVDVQPQTRDAVLKAVGDAGNEMRKRLGESLTSLKNFDQPLLEATTSSLEALQAFSKSKRLGAPTETIPHLKRALELDQNFALAYANLGAAYINVGEITLGMENLKKAYELRARVSQRERFYIEASYYSLVTRDLDKGKQSAKEWGQSYPADWRPHNDLAIIYAQLGDAGEAVREMREAIRLSPDNPGAYANLMGVLCAANRLNEAQAVYEETRSRNLGSPYLLQYKYGLDFLRGDAAGMQEQLRLATGVPRTEDVLLSAQADTEAYYGRLEQARNFSRRAVDSAERADAMEAAATWEGWGALRETETGNLLEARRDAEQALALNRGRDIRVLAALALARAGDIVQAQQLAESADQEFPQDTLLQNYALPSIRAAIQLQQNKPLIAIETLEVSRPYELSQGSLTYMYPAYLRGEAYLKTGEGGKAAAEFKKILDHRGIVLNSPIAALAYLDLARSYVMHNDKAKAKAAYQDFLALWNNANPDIPIYKQAKAEYATLQ
jgi:serine/threonine protein kinase/DNA-binding winged helix-turn-helix (wHTH) protein/tetratricopeptide (TPR) repeat protein